jgi:hypothetical protein
MEFVPDPDFLARMNANMANNDGNFGQRGKKVTDEDKV